MQVQGITPSNLSMAASQAPTENVNPNAAQESKFDTSNSLSGDSNQDKLLLNIVISLVQLLMQQLGQQQQGNDGNNGSNGQQENSNNSNSNGDFSSQFSSKDKGLLLNAIGTNPASGTTISDISDSNASGHLNDGDNLQLQANNNAQTHTLTSPEVSKFIEARNPPNTPKLPLTEQQTSSLQSQFSLEDVSMADTSGNQSIGVGDILTGTQNQNGSKVRVDIPVDQAIMSLLGI